MIEHKLEIGSVTFEATMWDGEPAWNRTCVNYTNHGNHCGDSSSEVSSDISQDEALKIIYFLLQAFPQLNREFA